MTRKVLFIDRDGTLIREPAGDCQVDSLEKLEFMPGVFRNLYRLRHLTPYELVMVSNQDGLGTASFPEEDFLPVQEKILGAFRNEGVEFDAIHIDPSLPEENSPNRKPRTGMLTRYMSGEVDLEHSFVIGDRLTDIELAKNLGCRAILYAEEREEELEEQGLDTFCSLISNDWDRIAQYLRSVLRYGEVKRVTGETDVEVRLSLDGEGRREISTGLGFLDHMLDQLGRHGGMDLTVRARGDLHVDEHHTIEDTALALGEAFSAAIGDKLGMERYGFVLPMDDSMATVAVDFGGRPWIRWNVEFQRDRIGDVPTEMFFHFFKSFSDTARCNLSIEVEGENDHHKIEAVFKGFARALRQAVRIDPEDQTLPTTKGKL